MKNKLDMLYWVVICFLVIFWLGWISIFVISTVISFNSWIVSTLIFASLLLLIFIFIAILKDRMNNKDDNYYSKNIDR